MNARAMRIFEEALALPREQRSELARKLLESLPDGASPEVAKAWTHVIESRAREVLAGTAPTRDIDEALDEIQTVTTNSARFDTWKEGLVRDDAILGGEPVFPKSRLAVRRIGGMRLKGISIDDVKKDYPYLTDEDIEFAKLYAIASMT